MPNYRVYGKIGGTKYLGLFEADNAEDAVDKALDEGDTDVGLCHHCAHIIGSDLEIDDAVAELVEEETNKEEI